MPGAETLDVVIIGLGMACCDPCGGARAVRRAHRHSRARQGSAGQSRGARRARGLSARRLSSQETWIDGAGAPFNPGQYYYVGGNTKFYGAVLIRYRSEDFAPVET